MATREEVKSALAKRLNKYKVQTPTRIAYLGDGRGQATSNIVPPGEPDKFWARESLNGEKPFKVLNRNPNFTPAFNLPILLGYPEDDPDTEQVMGIHRGLVQFSTGNAGSAIGGVAPHHIKHEWGGGDEVFVDPRMFKPGLVKPTAPASMFVKILSFEHYYNEWRRYEGGTSPDLTQYKPNSDYRYVLLCLDPDTNQLTVRPGATFTPDLSVDSIISNQAQNTFRHIPVPPGNEIPLGVVLLEPGTTKIDWNINGINNLLPMRLLLGAPMKEVNERISALESATGISSLPSTGAANSVQTDLLPARIDGNITRLVLNRSGSSSTLPTLFVGELGFVNNSPSQIWVGTASGNHLFNPGGGGGGATTLGDLTDVNVSTINDQYVLKYDAATSSWIGGSSIRVGDSPSGIYWNVGGSLVGITAPLRIDNPDGTPIIQTDYGALIDSVDQYPVRFSTPAGAALWVGGLNGNTNELIINPDSGGAKMSGLNNSGTPLFEFSPLTGFRFSVTNAPSALFVNTTTSQVVFSGSATASLMVVDTTVNAVQIGTSIAGQIADFRNHLIEFNKNKNDVDLIIRGTTADRFVFIDTGNESFGINTASPNASYRLHVVANGTANSLFERDSSTDATLNVLYNPNTTNGNNAIVGFSTDTSGAGAAVQKSGGQIRLYFDEHNDSSYRTHFEFWTRQSGFSNKFTIGAGAQIGSPTGGDQGQGVLNAARAIYINSASHNGTSLHGAEPDGFGGFTKWSASAVSTTCAIVVPSGTGDVTYDSNWMYVVRHSGGGTNSGVLGLAVGTTTTLYSSGASVLQLGVQGNGEVFVRKTGGDGTYHVGLWGIWL